MHNSDKIFLSNFSQNSDFDPFFEEEYFQDIELDGELSRFMDMTDVDETYDFFNEDNSFN
jgi:hypothetical protein